MSEDVGEITANLEKDVTAAWKAAVTRVESQLRQPGALAVLSSDNKPVAGELVGEPVVKGLAVFAVEKSKQEIMDSGTEGIKGQVARPIFEINNVGLVTVDPDGKVVEVKVDVTGRAEIGDRDDLMVRNQGEGSLSDNLDVSPRDGSTFVNDKLMFLSGTMHREFVILAEPSKDGQTVTQLKPPESNPTVGPVLTAMLSDKGNMRLFM